MKKNLDLRVPTKRSFKSASVPLKVQKVSKHPPEAEKAKGEEPVILPRFIRPRIAVGVAVGVIILALVLLAVLILPEARIKVFARSEPKTADFEIRVDRNQEQLNASELAIPGKILEQELFGTKIYPATGRRNIGKKASGFVSIYNFSKTTLILKAQTTVLTLGDKRYFFTQDAGGIRPTALIGLEEQEVDPSSLIPPVPVVASESGEALNLPKGTRLEIENEVFGKQPKLLYAVVEEEISGGTTEEVKIVTAGDLVLAQEALIKDLVGSAKQVLAQGSAGLILPDNAMVTDVLETKHSVVANTEAFEFETLVKIRLRGLAYSEADVLKIITERIKRLLPENKVLTSDPQTRLQSNFVSINLEQGNGILNNHFEGKVIYQIREEGLVEKIRGKTAPEIREILLSRPEIEKVEIKFYPFWVEKAPRFSKKIYFEKFEEESGG